MAQITYGNKSAVYSNPDIPDENKVNATDMNEIKSVVNQNDSNSLYKNNSTQFIPSNDYEPSTKQYVDRSNAGASFSFTGSYTLTTSNQLLALNNTIASNCQDSEFTLATGTDAGKILIGNNVNYILVSASITTGTEYTAGDSVELKLHRTRNGNNEIIFYGRTRVYSASAYETIPVSPIIISVQTGDLLYLTARNTTGARGTLNNSNNCLTVMKIS